MLDQVMKFVLDEGEAEEETIYFYAGEVLESQKVAEQDVQRYDGYEEPYVAIYDFGQFVKTVSFLILSMEMIDRIQALLDTRRVIKAYFEFKDYPTTEFSVVVEPNTYVIRYFFGEYQEAELVFNLNFWSRE